MTTGEGEAEEEIAAYAYDAFNRRVRKVVGETTEETVWSGWRALEQYENGRLRSRRTYGRGLDEVVLLEQDLDGNGLVEMEYVPLYDETGNLVMVTRNEDAEPLERYEYTPYGTRTILVDSTPPAIEQVRVKDGRYGSRPPRSSSRRLWTESWPTGRSGSQTSTSRRTCR